MFKKAKGGSGFKSGKVSPGDHDKKEVLEALGYAFDSISKKSGWSWSTSDTRSDANLGSEGDAINDAWQAAGSCTCAALQIPDATWARMGQKEQAELIREALG